MQSTAENKKWGNLGFGLAILFVVGYSLMLIGSVGTQLAIHDLPCPLCVLQRLSMAMTSIGPMYIIIQTLNGKIDTEKFATGYGLSLIFSIFGMVACVRQLLLHIAPNDPGFGPAVLGIHFYTWSLVTFIVVIAFCGVNLAFAKYLTPTKDASMQKLGDLALKLMFFMVVLMFVLMIFQEGFNFKLPDDPTHYQLFDLFK
ncbi:disulfide bond formation protein B [Lactobacillus sp. YT155]|uniref:disulfide bond formation protein B n=1 Tax=Lactobacillus sp. YT155 TaxID=3060955 RepID=UPI00265DBA3F|nr:disulfide bond formation protein B [Lactobacillus sp. YT155]MDO1605505.1 disulfide bond formation protein B [Lactobacillus sp. YT155]